MKLNALANAISRHVWHIEESHAQSLLPIAVMLIEKGESIVVNVDDSVSKPFALSAISGTQYGLDAQHEEGLIAIFPINGPMMKNDTPSGEPGTATMGTWLKQARENPSVIGGIMLVDSPGGQVDGNETLHNEIKTFDKVKPLVTFVNGYMCSAAYEVGSAPREIIASERANLIGSIGTMFKAIDSKGRMEQLGYKIVEAYADDSTEKNKAYNELVDGKPKKMKQEILNPLNNLFLQTVKENRGDKLKADEPGVLSGTVFTAELAVANGLIDSIGNFDYAIQRVRELAGAKKSANSKTDNTMQMKAAWNNLLAFFNIKAEEEVTDVQMEQLNTQLGSLQSVTAERDAANAEVTRLLSELNDNIQQRAAIEASVIALTADRDGWKKKAEDLGAQDASDVREVAGEKDKLDQKDKTELPSARVMREHYGE